jgi:tetratricopeptide (TPR) repeat protein
VKAGFTRLAAVVLAAAATAARAAPPDVGAERARVAEAGRRLVAAEERLLAAEALGASPDESPRRRAASRLERGRAQHALGDWRHAAVLLAGAVDAPELREAPERAEALFLLADSLRRQGACGAARPRYAELLALGAGERRGEAVSGALACAVAERRSADLAPLLREADAAFGEDAPAEVRYHAAKALHAREDLPLEERRARAAAAFEKVGAPFQTRALYFLGVLRIEQQDLHGSLQWFDACARAEPDDPREADVRELCILALGRVHAEMGNAAAALEWYRVVPWYSPRFGEALYELAWDLVKTQQHEQALRTASFITDLVPGSPFAPEATVLRGHLLLKLGRYAEATDAYNQVINAYAPVRDELDAILSLREDPVRWFNELVGARGEDFDATSVLPPVAVRWAATSRDLALALELVESLDAARRDVREAGDAADRLEALLGRGGGLDAFPALQRAWAGADAVENDAARIEGDLVATLSGIAGRALAEDPAAGLRRAGAARAALEGRLAALPRTQEEADARARRVRARVDQAAAAAFRTGFLVESLEAAVGGTEAFLERHRAEIDADPAGRQELAEELRKHREVARGYAEELRALERDVAQVRDAAAGAEAMGGEARLRADVLAAIEAERLLAEAARGSVPEAEREAFDRADEIRERLATVRARARALKLGLVADAARRAEELRGEVAAERAAIAAHAAALDGVQAGAKELVGRIAGRALEEVRGQFYRLVLKADLGIVDVAWSRKRARLDRIQALSVQKSSEIEQLDREYRSMLQDAREVDE